MPTPIQVMLVDDHVVVRKGLQAWLDVFEDLLVVAEAGSGAQAWDQLQSRAAYRELPDVVLLDLVLPDTNGAVLAGEITRQYCAVRVVALTGFGETERVHTALANGAAGYLLKDADPSEIITAIRAATQDEVFLDPTVARQLTHTLVGPSSGWQGLTRREREVLALVAQGYSNQHIADALVIRERTARTHVSHVLRKLQLTSRTQAALTAIRHGLVTGPET